MVWENNIFYLLLLNVITGTAAFLICLIMIPILRHLGRVKLVYNLLKGVAIFFAIPFAYIYVRVIKGAEISGELTGYDGNELVASVFHLAFDVWLIGAICVSIFYLVRYLWTRRLAVNNIPYSNPVVEDIFYNLYPGSRLDKVSIYQNFLVKSPCIMGIIRPKLILPEKEYSPLELKIILAHEATHVIHRDNLWKTIGLAVVISCWWNPLIYLYLKFWENWSETYCDVTVCRKFLNWERQLYVMVLLKYALFSEKPIPPMFATFGGNHSVKRRIERMSKVKGGRARIFVSVAMTTIFILGSGLTAFAAGNATSEVGITAYLNTLEETSELNRVRYDLSVVDNENVFVMSAEEVAESNITVVDMGLEGAETYATQKFFDWDIAAGNMAASGNFLKRKDKTIEISAYITSSGSVHLGVIRPDGSFVYCVAPANENTSTVYTTESLGYYKVAVYNVTSSSANASGYYVR